MNTKINYNTLMENVIEGLDEPKKLFLHSCCGPCSGSVIERLRPYFKLTAYYYNPNIEPQKEYEKRRDEQKKYLEKIGIPFIEGKYESVVFDKVTKGYEHEPEGGKRCLECFKLRLEKTASVGLSKGFDFFATTLTVSPHKNAPLINAIGLSLEDAYDIKYLVSDFKKKEGYKRSLEISEIEGFYRQDYCGCLYSKLKEERQCNDI